ncbi:K(+)-transporting ATPase subunit F [Biostraticola tofi]|uniref:K+-transporting ATPase KdpF subunit n=1 Tax=Biostraticola tofi TaxID=466109 RepID=A0A4V2W516_9GAMM|nr:K(+)-transporting ATPase subunit F [Biostraticola tofi]TCV97999.1 K+-transporting ATPase KdpF subunit [Biostraticola tofi]
MTPLLNVGLLLMVFVLIGYLVYALLRAEDF